MSEVVESARRIIAGTESWPDQQRLSELVDGLLGELQFAMARALLDAARRRYPEERWLTQQLALATYKDEELVPAARFARALELLRGIGLRDPGTHDAETLALGGAVLKRMWDYGGQIEHLYEAIAFYRAAYERNPAQDQGYGGANAAFLMDQLAAHAELVARRSGAPDSREAQQLRDDAQGLRVPILSDLVGALERDPTLATQYWFLATLAEVCFGLGEYPEAGAWLRRLRECFESGDAPAGEWKLQTTFRQLVLLARYQNIALPTEGSAVDTWHPAWQALSALLGKETETALSCYRGKVGLALSGGGFRASLFHLGVLARLAEVDALRGVEVLSTVSGGSIVGAHYYLELQRLLEEKPDHAVSRQDYIDLVRRVQADFLSGVQRNLRVRVFDDLRANLRLLFSPGYTRSKRLGELYEAELYARIGDGKAAVPRLMSDVLVTPKSGDGSRLPGFKPKFHNWRRRAKVPVLLLNTTSLNSGHNWFFTGSWMGEPPGLIGTEIDVNQRYRRLYYAQAPTEELRRFRLGHAVAASSCVPGMFEPLVLHDLYPDRTVRLVDGGVHDNQGVAGLLDEGCTLILCSDASGQMPDAARPGSDPAGVLLRVTGVLQDRVREAQYLDLRSRLESRSLSGVFFIHTKKELHTHPLDWVGCDEPPEASDDAPTDPCTSYGVDRIVQRKLSELRTDLDAFSEVEAYALMASGYLMARRELEVLQQRHTRDGQPGTWGDYDLAAPTLTDWPFSPMIPILGSPAGASAARTDLEMQLDIGKSLFLKAWRSMEEVRRALWYGLGAAALLLTIFLWVNWEVPLITWGGLTMLALGLLLAAYAPLLRAFNPTAETRNILTKLALASAGYLWAKVHLRFVDPLFLARGRLSRLLGLD